MSAPRLKTLTVLTGLNAMDALVVTIYSIVQTVYVFNNSRSMGAIVIPPFLLLVLVVPRWTLAFTDGALAGALARRSATGRSASVVGTVRIVFAVLAILAAFALGLYSIGTWGTDEPTLPILVPVGEVVLELFVIVWTVRAMRHGLEGYGSEAPVPVATPVPVAAPVAAPPLAVALPATPPAPPPRAKRSGCTIVLTVLVTLGVLAFMLFGCLVWANHMGIVGFH